MSAAEIIGVALFCSAVAAAALVPFVLLLRSRRLGWRGKTAFVLVSLAMPVAWMFAWIILGMLVADPLDYFYFLTENEDVIMLATGTAHWQPLAFHFVRGWFAKRPAPLPI